MVVYKLLKQTLHTTQKKLMSYMENLFEGYEGQMIRQDTPMNLKELKTC